MLYAGRVQSYGEPGSQAPQRVRAALHAGPHDPVVTPVLEPIDCQSAAGAVGFRRYRLDLAKPLPRHIAQKCERGVYVALRHRAAAALLPGFLREAVQRFLHRRGRPNGEEQACGVVLDGRLSARRPLFGHRIFNRHLVGRCTSDPHHTTMGRVDGRKRGHLWGSDPGEAHRIGVITTRP